MVVGLKKVFNGEIMLYLKIIGTENMILLDMNTYILPEGRNFNKFLK